MEANNLFICIAHLSVNRIIGTPTEATWPGVTTLKNWNGSFPVWPRLQLSYFVPALCDQGIDLLEVCIILVCGMQ